MGDIRYPMDAAPEHGAAIEVAEGILWLRLPLPMALDHVNVFALDDGESWTIVDTGFDSRKSRAIWNDILIGPLMGKQVGRVLITHHHPDHVGLAGWFQERGAELLMPRTGWLTTRMLQLDEQPGYTAAALDFYRKAGMADDVFEARQTERPFNFSDCTHPLAWGYSRIQDGDTIRAAGRTWAVRMGDGHAPEHATLWSQDDDLIIAGDQLLPSISPNIGVYPTEPEADPLGEWLASCQKFAALAEKRHYVLPGHKLPFTGLPKRLRQLEENHTSALDRLMKTLDTPKRAGDCFLPIFKRDIRGSQYGLALVEALAHLNHLYATGKVTRTLGDDGAWWFQAS